MQQHGKSVQLGGVKLRPCAKGPRVDGIAPKYLTHSSRRVARHSKRLETASLELGKGVKRETLFSQPCIDVGKKRLSMVEFGELYLNLYDRTSVIAIAPTSTITTLGRSGMSSYRLGILFFMEANLIVLRTERKIARGKQSL